MKTEEREIKFYIQDLEALANRMQDLGLELIRPRTLERNLRLDTPDHSLRNSARLLRLRQDDRVRITYKGDARFEDGVIARTEIEFVVDDFEMALRLFESLGYQVVVVYEKFRSEYQGDDVVIMLDELPFGNFIEIEGSNNASIESAARLLRLDWSRGIGTNYLGLFEIVQSNLNLPFNDLTFDNFEGLAIPFDALQVLPADA